VNKVEESGTSNDFGKKQEREEVQTILETLPISVRMEMEHISFKVGNVVNISKSKDSGKEINFRKTVTPMTQRLLVNLPFFLINISVPQLQCILYLAEVWSLKGYNLLHAL